MKKILFVLMIVWISFFGVPRVHADYVLPYPSYMPGNKLYRITRIADSLKKYWYFGNLAAISYRASLADKYLVEAKTLAEYKQYLLGMDALKRSDQQVMELRRALSGAASRYSDLTSYRLKISLQMEKHIQVLRSMRSTIPDHVTWVPEKSRPEELNFSGAIEESMKIRQTLQGIP